jgi:hypothetical protein
VGRLPDPNLQNLIGDMAFANRRAAPRPSTVRTHRLPSLDRNETTHFSETNAMQQIQLVIRHLVWLAAAFVGGRFFETQPARAVVIGSIDSFQDGTTQGWGDGGPRPGPVNIAAGGPAGGADRFLQVSSGSFGGASHLITFNAAQWGGNYLSAGVSKVTMDLKNFGAQTLSMRIALRPTGGSSGTAGYSSSSAFSLPADAAWHHATFLIDAADLTAVNGPTPLATFLTSVGE